MVFLSGPVEKAGVIEEKLRLCGYFVLVTLKKMTIKEAVMLYKSRNASKNCSEEINPILETRASVYILMKSHQQKYSLSSLHLLSGLKSIHVSKRKQCLSENGQIFLLVGIFREVKVKA